MSPHLVVAILLAVSSLPARAEDCPPGTTLVRVERSADEEHTYCSCQAGYVARHNQCVLAFPAIAPGSFVSANHRSFVQRELDQARSRKERLSREKARLDAMREAEDGYLRELGEMREQLLYDSVADALSVISADEFLAGVPGLSPNDARKLARAARLIKANVDYMAMAQSRERGRRRDKAYDAASAALSLLADISIPANERQILETAIEVFADAMKAADPSGSVNGKTLSQRVAATLDGLAALAGDVYAPVGIARSGVDLFGAGLVAWHIHTDSDAIVEALVSAQRARLAMDKRLAETEELIRFYEVENLKSESR